MPPPSVILERRQTSLLPIISAPKHRDGTLSLQVRGTYVPINFIPKKKSQNLQSQTRNLVSCTCWISATKSLQDGSVTVAALTEQPLVVLWFSFEQADNPLDWAKLHLHVCQVTHHPVHIVGYLIHGGRRRRGSGYINYWWQRRIDLIISNFKKQIILDTGVTLQGVRERMCSALGIWIFQIVHLVYVT